MDRFSYQLVCYGKKIIQKEKQSETGDASNFEVLIMKDRGKQSFLLHTKVVFFFLSQISHSSSQKIKSDLDFLYLAKQEISCQSDIYIFF